MPSPVLPFAFGLEVRPNMHAGSVPPDEEGFPVLVRLIYEFQRSLSDLLIHRLHAFNCEWAGVFADLFAPGSEAWVRRRRVFRVRSLAFQNAARTEHCFEFGIFRIIRVLRLLLGIEMVEVSEKHIEAVNRRHKIVTIPKVVLPELSGFVTKGFE